MQLQSFWINALRYFARNIWNMVPPKLKNKNDVEIFKYENRTSNANANSACHI